MSQGEEPAPPVTLRHVARYDGPDLVYGMWRGQGFVVVGRDWAAAAAKELQAIFSARTWREAVDVVTSAVSTWTPIDEDFLDDYEPDEEFDVGEVPGYGDGDWPPMVCSYTANFLPDDWPVGEVYSTTLNGEGVIIDPVQEPRLIELARAAGASLTRDDAAIDGLDPDW